MSTTAGVIWGTQTPTTVLQKQPDRNAELGQSFYEPTLSTVNSPTVSRNFFTDTNS